MFLFQPGPPNYSYVPIPALSLTIHISLFQPGCSSTILTSLSQAGCPLITSMLLSGFSHIITLDQPGHLSPPYITISVWPSILSSHYSPCLDFLFHHHITIWATLSLYKTILVWSSLPPSHITLPIWPCPSQIKMPTLPFSPILTTIH